MRRKMLFTIFKCLFSFFSSAFEYSSIVLALYKFLIIIIIIFMPEIFKFLKYAN